MLYNDIIIVDFVSTLVDQMRDTGVISAISAKQTNGTYIVTGTNSTKAIVGDFVIIGTALDLEVTAKTSNNFTVKPIYTTSLAYTSGLTWKTAKPYFEYGHALEIANMIMEKDESHVYKYQKYPLVALYLDIPETRFSKDDIPNVECSLYLILVQETKQEYTASERQTNVFKPVLYPLYNKLMTVLEANRKLFLMGIDENFTHKKTDKYLHNSDGTNQNTLNAFVDAIEIENLKLKIKLVETC
jgi:hypothetical protein